MMSIVERVTQNEREALKRGDSMKLSTLRMLRSSLHNAEIALQKRPLPDGEAMKVIRTEVKRREDAAGVYEKGGRPDRASAERLEADVLKFYLPPEMSADQLQPIVTKVIASLGATNPSDLGKVMKAVMAEVGPTAPGKLVNELVRKALTADN